MISILMNLNITIIAELLRLLIFRFAVKTFHRGWFLWTLNAPVKFFRHYNLTENYF